MYVLREVYKMKENVILDFLESKWAMYEEEEGLDDQISVWLLILIFEGSLRSNFNALLEDIRFCRHYNPNSVIIQNNSELLVIFSMITSSIK
jgi:hypothetical protein